LALVVLSVLEQRLDAVRLVLAGADVTEVAAQLGVHRSTVHRWMARYLTDQVAGLADRSHRPVSCPHQASADLEVRGHRRTVLPPRASNRRQGVIPCRTNRCGELRPSIARNRGHHREDLLTASARSS
jgi:transposase-like protein